MNIPPRAIALADDAPSTADVLRPIALELRHFRLVLAVQQLGGLTRAGEHLNLTQSALSHQLREIEDRLGMQLFLRAGKKLLPTDAGKRVAEAATSILRAVLDVEDELFAEIHDRSGTLRVTTECYTCYDWIPEILTEFEQRYPDVRVEIVAEATGRAVEALLEGSVDLALTTCPPARDVRQRELFDDELVLAMAPDHRLASKPFVVPADLTGERLILYGPPRQSLFYKLFFAGSGFAPKEVSEIHLTQATLAMIAAGSGVAPLAVWAIRGELQRRVVTTVRLGRGGMLRRWFALVRDSRRVPPYIDDFIDMVIRNARRAIAENRCA